MGSAECQHDIALKPHTVRMHVYRCGEDSMMAHAECLVCGQATEQYEAPYGYQASLLAQADWADGNYGTGAVGANVN